MATLIIRSVQNNPLRLALDFNGNRYVLEYENKQAMFDALQRDAIDTERLELALVLALKEWRKTDPNFNNAAGIVNKTFTIPAPIVTIT